MKKEELMKQLQLLVEKWKGKVPKENSKLWWKYRCDKCLSIRLRYQLEHSDEETPLLKVVTDADCTNLYL